MDRVTLCFHTDEGVRKGCHPITRVDLVRGKKTHTRIFSIDEPGAWWDDHWNCHVDGCDIKAEDMVDALSIGTRFYGITDYDLEMGGPF